MGSADPPEPACNRAISRSHRFQLAACALSGSCGSLVPHQQQVWMRRICSRASRRPQATRRSTPSGRVPTLDDDGVIIWESSAILLYLADKFPEARLMPRALAERGHVYQLALSSTTRIGARRLSATGRG